MLTKDDLKAIKEIVQVNNNVLATIIKVELAATNKRIDVIDQNIKELQRSTLELQKTTKELQISTIELQKTTQELQRSTMELQKNIQEIKQSQMRVEKKIDKLDYEERIKQLEKRLKALEAIVENLTATH